MVSARHAALVVGMVLGLALCGNGGIVVAQDQGESQPAGDFNELFTQWKAVLADLLQYQDQYRAADRDQLPAIREKYNARLAEGKKLFPAMRDAGLAKLKEAPNENEDVVTFLLQYSAEGVQTDNYEDAYEILNTMKSQGVKHPAVDPLLVRAAFGSDHYKVAADLFEELTKRPNAQEIITEEVAMAGTVAQRTLPLWEKEQEIRAKEAEADDLPRVRIETSQGTVVVELYENEAPGAVGNFVSLVENKFYDGLTFHRVIEGFMAQGGCPKGDGTGGPGYQIYCETQKPEHRKHFRGTLSMAHAGRDTGGSQFFLTFLATPHLDGQHTAFGRVIEGHEVLGKLQRRDPQSAGAPRPDKIIKAEVIRKRDHEYKPNKSRG